MNDLNINLLDKKSQSKEAKQVEGKQVQKAKAQAKIEYSKPTRRDASNIKTNLKPKQVTFWDKIKKIFANRNKKIGLDQDNG